MRMTFYTHKVLDLLILKKILSSIPQICQTLHRLPIEGRMGAGVQETPTRSQGSEIRAIEGWTHFLRHLQLAMGTIRSQK